MRKLDLTRNSEKFLEKLLYSDKKTRLAIGEKIRDLLADPTPNSCKKLVGQNNLYRIRIDKYRVIYSFDDDYVHILHIAKREEVYDFLLNR